MIKSIGHTAITVQDMEASLKFYTEAMGFEKVFSIPNPANGEPWIEYLSIGNGQFIELFYGGSVPNPWNGKLIGFNHLCFLVDDLKPQVEKVRALGYPIDTEPKEGADHNWQAWTRDPNGIRIELMMIDPRSPQAKYM